MKITANRKDDILKRKAQYDADRAAYEADRDDRNRRFRDAERNVLNPIRDYLKQLLSRYTALEFTVAVDGSTAMYGGIRVNVQCDEHRKFEDAVALAWNYTVTIDDKGAIKSESSSWSGLKATTPAQLTSLKQTVDAIEALQSVNWSELLNVKLPAYEDFYEGALRQPARENFEAELAQAEMEEYTGTNTAIQVTNWDSSGYRGRTVYIRIIRETPSQYEVNIIPEYELNNYTIGAGDINKRWTQRVRKSSVSPVMDGGQLVTVDLG